MKTTAVIAEFNPFHNGHGMLLGKLRSETDADFIIIVLSGDYTQRGEAAITDRYSRAVSALENGADLVLELPVYYSLGSAEYFARGAVSILNGIGVTDTLGFGAETPDIDSLSRVADALEHESADHKASLKSSLSSGVSFAAARQKALTDTGIISPGDTLVSAPNNILAIEYMRALMRTGSSIRPVASGRTGDHLSDDLTRSLSSAAIRRHILSGGDTDVLERHVPSSVAKLLTDYPRTFGCNDLFSDLLWYRLMQLTAASGWEALCGYADVSEPMARRICSLLPSFTGFTGFTYQLKTKDISFTRASRALFHILLDIRSSNLNEYVSDGFTSYCRILGFRKSSGELLHCIKERSCIPVIGTLSEADSEASGMSPLQRRLFLETVASSRIYSRITGNTSDTEKDARPVII